MLTHLEESIRRLEENWSTDITPRELTVSDSIGQADVSSILADVGELRELFDGRNLILEIGCEPDGVFEYRLTWETNGRVLRQEQADSEAEASRLAETDEAKSAVERVREGSVSGRDELVSSVTALLQEEQFSCSVEYRVSGAHIDEYVQSVVGGNHRVTYYFSRDGFQQSLSSIELEDVREFFYNPSGKRIFLIRDIEGEAYGSDIGIFEPSDVGRNSFETFLERESYSSDQLRKVRQECAIDYYEERYLTPTYLKLDRASANQFTEKLQTQLAPLRLWFGILGVSNIARSTSRGWEIRINGRRVIESRVSLDRESNNHILIESNGDGDSLEVDEKLVSEFMELFNWIYASRTTDRMEVFRNIVTLYSTTLLNALREIDEIAESVESNFQYYIQDSIEEFVGVQQDVSEYVFKTHREMADIRRGLSNNLSQDIFRVFVFTVISSVGIVTQLNRVANIRLALAIALVPVCIYVGLGLRTTYSLGQQFQSVQKGRDQYYEMYENRIDSRTMEKIKRSDGGETIQNQFHTDKWIYYILFAAILIISVLAIIDLVSTAGPLSSLVESLSTG